MVLPHILTIAAILLLTGCSTILKKYDSPSGEIRVNEGYCTVQVFYLFAHRGYMNTLRKNKIAYIGHYTILRGEIPAGTRLEVTSIKKYRDGSVKVIAVIMNGEYISGEVQISNIIERDKTDKDLYVHSLLPCDHEN